MPDFIIINEDVRWNCIRSINALPLDKYEVHIKRKGKSSKQRRYWHMCLDIVAKDYGEALDRLKHMIKENVLGVERWQDKKGGWHEMVRSSEDLDVSEYTKLIDYTFIVADHIGCTLPDPSHYGLEERT